MPFLKRCFNGTLAGDIVLFLVVSSKFISVLDPKEQAKYYIEKIRSLGKTTNQTLLIVFIPLSFLWLTEIEKYYQVADRYIEQMTARHTAFEKENQQKRQIDTIKSLIGQLYRHMPDSIRSYKASDRDSALHVIIKPIRAQQTKFTQRLASQAKKNVTINDSIRLNLEKLIVPVNIPILNVKFERVGLKWTVPLVMIFFSIMLVYAYMRKQKIINTLSRFKEILHNDYSNASAKLYKDYDFSLPFWFFPLQKERTVDLKEETRQQTLQKIIGLDSRSLRISNMIVWIIYILFLLANLRLLVINWDLNYKVLHKDYSLSNAIGILLFMVDVLFIILISNKINEPHTGLVESNQLKNNNRRKFIVTMSIATIGSFLAEPIYGRLANGEKWYHNPRFRPKTKYLPQVKKGMYMTVKNKKENTGPIYYFNRNGKNPVMKTLSGEDWKKFASKLKMLGIKELLSHNTHLLRTKQQDLLQYVLERKEDTDGFKLLIRYLEVNPDVPTVEFIDLYTRMSTRFSLPSGQTMIVADKKIAERIAEIISNNNGYLKGYLTGKDLFKNIDKNESAKADTIRRMLKEESSVRLKKWQVRSKATTNEK
ncbi:hypothetical protein HB364_17735 [Pseudoflavitalea sp. X16]|uniref:hypothetical protein n=1 Tax=Paraflavitalea devenefica TaxID=2716334 RepID=UPI00142233DA|nr:hypothetical protein [Paraflavitalea devenefica]NII26936.1 hypothetical protein [Paraflavitalea devenefica]